MNLSEDVEDAQRESSRKEEAEAWRKRNAQAIEDYNRRVERGGLFGDRWREF